MIVVSDTSPLNYLLLIGHSDVLPKLFGRVLTPPAVIAELLHEKSPTLVRAWATAPPPWLEVRAPAQIDVSMDLGPGEGEAISLARELAADAVLIDERQGAAVAKQSGIFVVGTLGVLVVAADKGLLALPQAIAALRQTSFRASEEVYMRAMHRNLRR